MVIYNMRVTFMLTVIMSDRGRDPARPEMSASYDLLEAIINIKL